MSIDAQYFAELYAGDEDPWAFRTRWYERRKRELIMACLPRQFFERIFEPACANGELSALLAERCARLVCQDLNTTAVSLARQRLAGFSHASVELGRLPADWPGERFDLIVLGEIGYYLDADDWLRVIEQSLSSLTEDGGLLACHWRHPIDGCPQDGQQVHAMLEQHLPLHRLLLHDEADFQLAYWTCRPRAIDLEERCL
ncbi:class I SAM-dependent methyltransferase [Pseudomonas cremoricolorata]|uniref:Methyltransferase n=1 Tax=Pseudomonas cremoricolorata TaxID=157783 RepID=A0A089WP81_9PSED|nr:SAM-dependent methyltransferase [Pseudomonas cremoricolorata]AIR91100.1 methyltransferase [Pseudomonas cremoricolorata]